MKKITIDDVDSGDSGDGVDRRALSEYLETTGVAINHYRIPPGDGFPGGLHAHLDQEEVFVVLAGAATFETLVPRDGVDHESGEPVGKGGEVTVGAGEAIRFAPGEFQSGRNDAAADLVALALGAPRDSEDVRLPVRCPDCGRADVRLEADGGVTFVCPDCDAEHVPRDCPDCGSDDLRVTLGEGNQTVVVCQDCDAEFDEPPLRD